MYVGVSTSIKVNLNRPLSFNLIANYNKIKNLFAGYINLEQ